MATRSTPADTPARPHARSASPYPSQPAPVGKPPFTAATKPGIPDTDEFTWLPFNPVPNWGLGPLGYHLLPSYYRTPTHSSRWAHPNTHTLTEEPHLEDSERTVDNFHVHIYFPDEPEPGAAHITLAVVRKRHQRRAPGSYSPLYDPLTGQTTNEPGTQTTSGEALWHVDSRTLEEFQAAIAQVHIWLTNRAACNALTALTPPHPHQ